MEKKKADFLQNIDSVIDSTDIGKFGKRGEPDGKDEHGRLGTPTNYFFIFGNKVNV